MAEINKQPSSDESEFLSIKAAAKHIEVSQNSIRAVIDSGELKAYQFGVKIYRIKLDDLDDYIGGSLVIPNGPKPPKKPLLSIFKHLRPQSGDKGQRKGRK